jgi:hypothetical protein
MMILLLQADELDIKWVYVGVMGEARRKGRGQTRTEA